MNENLGICKLNGCYETVYPGFDFCTKDHGLKFNFNSNNDSNNHNNNNNIKPTLIWIKETPFLNNDMIVYNHLKIKYSIIHLFDIDDIDKINLNSIDLIISDIYYNQIFDKIKQTIIITDNNHNNQNNQNYISMTYNQIIKHFISNNNYNNSITETTNEIKFYNINEKYYEFSNFYIGAPFYLDGMKWKTSEHYFQAQKFSPHIELIEIVNNLSTPREAFNYSRIDENKNFIRKDWEQVKETVMYNALFAKFTQNIFLKSLLLNTANLNLIEDSPIDNYWGIGDNGNGLNRLGIILMKLRDNLKILSPCL